MKRKVRDFEYAALAELRYRIRHFVQGSDQAALSAGIEPQQYQMLLAIRGLSNHDEASIGRLAERMLLRHHSAVGLIDRLESQGFVRRTRSRTDLRRVRVSLLPRGKRVLEDIVRQRMDELRDSGHAFVAAIAAILNESGWGGNNPTIRSGDQKRTLKPSHWAESSVVCGPADKKLQISATATHRPSTKGGCDPPR
jgi:DNA-binding MarR family transcriptional regulator